MQFPSHIISLYEFVIYFALILTGIAQQNVFLLALVLGVSSKELPVRITKKFVKSPRPQGAFDCSVLNTGGAPHENGFPSGHTTFASFIFAYSLYEFLRIRDERKQSAWSVIAITGLFFVLMPIARVHRKCHSVPQVIGGIVYGFVWAGVFILFEKHILLKNNRYKADKLRFEEAFFPK